MGDCIASCARDHLLPIARDHLVRLVRDRLLPLLEEVANTIRGVPKDVEEIKDILEKIEKFINDANRMAEAEDDKKQLREAAFAIEVVIDEYMICEGKQPPDPGCEAFCCVAVDFVNMMKLRLQIAHKIQGIKSQIHGINLEHEPRSHTSQEETLVKHFLEVPQYPEENEVVGLRGPIDQLMGWLVKGRKQCTVVSVVGMGGQGKSTLAYKVFNNPEVIRHFFDCRVKITDPQPNDVDGLLRRLLQEIWNERNKDQNERNKDPPHDVSTMDRESQRKEVRKYLKDVRYVIFLDNVQYDSFWTEFKFALIDNKNGSRILITTRNKDVAKSCRRFSFAHDEYEMQPLIQEESLELFYKKAFNGSNCRENFKDLSREIVEKCEGLPLAIVAIGQLLSGDGVPLNWRKFSENLSTKWDNNPHLTAITKILSSSYHDLPLNLQRCFLYLGTYPKDYEVKIDRLIRQWIAEEFVKKEKGKTKEEVARQYLTQLINKNLVQVSSVASDGKAKSCRVHNIVRQMILDIIQELSFCHFTSESEDQSLLFTGMIRCLTIATGSNNLGKSVQSSNIRSLHVFRNEELPDSFLTSIPSKHSLLKVLDFEDFPLYHHVPQNLGVLTLLSYLSFRNTKITSLPGSIGLLINLETLDIRQTMVREMPREIINLRKLRHLLAYDKSKGVRHGIRMKAGIRKIASLQTLCDVEADHGGDELVKELEGLTLLRMLGVTNVKQEYTSALCSSINKMRDLEELHIAAIDKDEVLDLRYDVSTPYLGKLRLIGKLYQFPNWVGGLRYLAKLSLSHSMLTDDPLAYLKDLQNLLYLSILYNAFEGDCLHFSDGGFQNLKQLVLDNLDNLNSILIDSGALRSLEKFMLVHIPALQEVPSGVYNLSTLKIFQFKNMPDEFEQSIDHDRGQHFNIEKLPPTSIADRFWP